MNVVQLIAKKRDREELCEAEVEFLINGFTRGDIPDYQMAAFAMAVLLNGMTSQETVSLTRSMLNSGDCLQWEPGLPVVDKHSTGGIGDKVSIPLAPMLACCGVRVPMISGRGLGPTGGTLDKLESIPGFRTDLSPEEISHQVNSCGCVITGASREIAPADRKLYELRDVTGTVESIPLITASILSKKLAAGLDALVLDVKFGSGAFMKTKALAMELAKSLVSVGNRLGVRTTAVLSNMDQTLGNYAGNAVEIQEAIELLAGQGAPDLKEITLELGGQLLSSVNFESVSDNRERLEKTISDGAALDKFNQMVKEQGGTPCHFDFPQEYTVEAPIGGFLSGVDARLIGFAIIEMGGGRKVKGEALNLHVGIRQLVRLGHSLKARDPLFQIVTKEKLNDELKRSVKELLISSVQITEKEAPGPQLIHEVITDESLGLNGND